MRPCGEREPGERALGREGRGGARTPAERRGVGRRGAGAPGPGAYGGSTGGLPGEVPAHGTSGAGPGPGSLGRRGPGSPSRLPWRTVDPRLTHAPSPLSGLSPHSRSSIPSYLGGHKLRIGGRHLRSSTDLSEFLRGARSGGQKEEVRGRRRPGDAKPPRSREGSGLREAQKRALRTAGRTCRSPSLARRPRHPHLGVLFWPLRHKNVPCSRRGRRDAGGGAGTAGRLQPASQAYLPTLGGGSGPLRGT